MNFEVPRPGKLLAEINSPADVRKLSLAQLGQLCEELRTFIIDNVSVYGGHFGAGLGVVELTVALHYIYNTPDDLLVWDVGHQAYGHKILTGRRDLFHTNRQLDGISGFPKRSESKYDTFGTGHSSTSISAALGMAVANKLNQGNKKVVAVIGDGALTAGLAYEALNNAGASKSDLLVVFNDNNISIDSNVGALNQQKASGTAPLSLADLKMQLSVAKEPSSANIENLITHSRAGMWIEENSGYSTLFTALGFSYFGPVDGHNLTDLLPALEALRDMKGPKLLHVLTVKGKGFSPAEHEQTKWHASGGSFDKLTGISVKPESGVAKIPTYQDVFGETLAELASEDEDIIAITPAMVSGSNLIPMQNKYPERVFDTGITEQHAVTFTAGLATQGKKVFCAIYSTFLQRGYDQLIHDVALQNLPVVFCIDRAGFVGRDGPTHHGLYDIAYLRAIPNMVISSPMNEQELVNMMSTAARYDKSPWAIRYPRGKATGTELLAKKRQSKIGKGRRLCDGQVLAVLSFGPLGNQVVEAAEILSEEGIQIGHYDMRFVKPLDTSLLDEIAEKYKFIITLEDGTIKGGFGGAVAEYYADKTKRPRIKILGAPDLVTGQGSQQQLYSRYGLDADGLVKTIRDIFKILEY